MQPLKKQTVIIGEAINALGEMGRSPEQMCADLLFGAASVAMVVGYSRGRFLTIAAGLYDRAVELIERGPGPGEGRSD